MIAVLVNSRFGVKNTPGGRARHLTEALDRAGVPWKAFVRESAADISTSKVTRYPLLLRHLPRALHAFQIYVVGKRYEFRSDEIRLFEALALRWLESLPEPPSSVYCLETAPRIAQWCERRAIPCLIDVQIAPQSYVARLYERVTPIPGLHFQPKLGELEQLTFHSSVHFAVPSTFVRDELLLDGVGEERVHVVEFGAPGAKGTVERESRVGRARFGFLGAVNARKGIASLLEAWDHPALRDCELHLCGRVFPEIRREIEKRSLSNVFTPGFVDGESYLRTCDAFVFPSLMEGSSKAVLEAMASGLPCIVSRQAGSPIDQENGLLVDPLDASAIREAMVRLSVDPELRRRLGEAAARRASGRSWQDYGRGLAEALSNLEAVG